MQVRFDSPSGATPGRKLCKGNMRVGEIMSATYSPLFGHWVGMAYIRTDAPRSGMILTLDSTGNDHRRNGIEEHWGVTLRT